MGFCPRHIRSREVNSVRDVFLFQGAGLTIKSRRGPWSSFGFHREIHGKSVCATEIHGQPM
eukprot:4134874-Lingulodinium_polyedra.AAC.1